MKVSEVSNEDGKACINLIKFLLNGRWDLSGKDAEVFAQTKLWVQGIAVQMGEHMKSRPVLPPTPAPSPTAPMKITGMGKLPSSSNGIKQKKKKK